MAKITKLGLLKIIKAHCRDCCGDNEPKDYCCSQRCALYPFRTGKDTVSERVAMSDEAKKRLTERLKHAKLASKRP